MSKTLEIRVVDTNWVPEPELCSNLKHKNPHICYGEYNYIDQALLDKQLMWTISMKLLVLWLDISEYTN